MVAPVGIEVSVLLREKAYIAFCLASLPKGAIEINRVTVFAVVSSSAT
jgi:hypothetical protein